MTRPDLYIAIRTRALTSDELVTPGGIDFVVSGFSHAIQGGPEMATIRATADRVSLFELVELLRCPIEIYHPEIGAVWWGYIESVSINAGPIDVGVSLAGMANRVAVAYSFIDPGTAEIGNRKTTAYSSNADSIAEYGIKQELITLGGATDAQAAQLAAAFLAQNKYPLQNWQRAASPSGGAMASATLVCRGWWSSLDWIMYSKATTATVETTTQIATMIAEAGQFFAGSLVLTPSGLSTGEYRDGESTARAEIEELLRTGTTGNSRLVATVGRDRFVKIQAEMSPTFIYSIDLAGDVRDPYENPIGPAVCPVGYWAQLRDVIPASADLSKTSNAGLAYIDRAEYNAERDEYIPIARGVPSPWDLGKLLLRG